MVYKLINVSRFLILKIAVLISSATAYKIFPMEYERMIFKNIEFSGINKLMLKFKVCVSIMTVENWDWGDFILK